MADCWNSLCISNAGIRVESGICDIACLAAGRELFKAAILCNAAGILMVHNHPSGSAVPSKEDEEISRRFYQAGKLLGIGLLDHVIYGDREHYYSFRQEGFFDTV